MPRSAQALLIFAILLLTGIAVFWPREKGADPIDAPAFATATALAEESTPPPRATRSPRSPTPAPVTSVAGDLADPFAWPRLSRRDLGCLIESAGGRDPKWDCNSPEESGGDPCAADRMEDFYRGPQIPSSIAARVSPLVDEVEIHWEHGKVQEIDLQIHSGVDEAAVRDALLPPGAEARVATTEIQLRGATRHLLLRAFERGSLECGDGRRPD